MLAIGVTTALVLCGSFSCTDRTAAVRSEVGQRIAEHLCPVQNNCGCPEEDRIPNCEARVERHFADKEREALEAGLEYDAECLEVFLDRIDDAGACAPQSFNVPEYAKPAPCPVYGGDHDVGETCELYEYSPLMTDCRAGLTCYGGICRDFVHLPVLTEGELCSECAISFGSLGPCDEGLRCDVDSKTCVPAIPLGAVCTEVNTCDSDAYCRTDSPDDYPSEDAPGTCQRRTTKPGEPCEHVGECELVGCVGACGSDEPFCVENACFVPPPALCDLMNDWFLDAEPTAND